MINNTKKEMVVLNPRKAFKKIELDKPLPLRRFEIDFGIQVRDGWASEVLAVQRLLDHLRRYTQSLCSREKYLRHIHQFCRWAALGPEKLVRLPRTRAASLVQKFTDELARKGSSVAYVNSFQKRLRTFFRVNGYTREKELDLRSYFMPARYRKRPEHVPTDAEVFSMADAAGSSKNRAVIFVLWSSGLRVSTLCAINYEDVADELKKGESCIKIPVYPAMKARVPDGCKGLVPYYVFICPQATAALKSYLREREEKYGPLGPEDPLFHSEFNFWKKKERSTKRLGRRAVGQIVKRAARLAGIKQWKHVSPHSLRKSFESVLRSPLLDGGRMDIGTQQFFFGHILPGSQDSYYDKTSIEFHRREYAKLDFSKSIAMTYMVDKVIPITELEKYFSDRWTFVAKINDDKVVVRRTGGSRLENP